MEKQQLRNLEAEDMFIVSSLIAKLGINEIGKIVSQEKLKSLVTDDEEKSVEKIGLAIAFDIAGLILKNLKNCKEEIYLILANVSGLGVDELSKLGAVEFTEMIIDVIMNPYNKGFFKLASRFLG